MAEEVAVETKVETPVETKVEPVNEDLVSRVSKVKVEPKKEEPTNPFGLTKEDYDKVQNDPVLSKFYKSMQSDYQRKTTDLAEQRRKISEAPAWSKEKILELQKDPKFISAVQEAVATQAPPNSGLTDQEYSALSDKEKAQLNNMQSELQQMKMQNWQMQQRQQDEVLKTKYANYAPDIVDVTINKLVKGEVKADREVVWKALDYDDAVKRAYLLGKEDRQVELKEKEQVSSPEGLTVTPQSQVPQIEKGESNTSYFKRLAMRRLAESKGLNK